MSDNKKEVFCEVSYGGRSGEFWFTKSGMGSFGFNCAVKTRGEFLAGEGLGSSHITYVLSKEQKMLTLMGEDAQEFENAWNQFCEELAGAEDIKKASI